MLKLRTIPISVNLDFILIKTDPRDAKVAGIERLVARYESNRV